MRLKNDIFDHAVNVLCVLILIGIVVYLAVSWNSLPDQVPGLIGLDGEVTRWDGKGTLILMPIIAWVTFAGVTILEQFPKAWNTGVRVTEENMFRVYRAVKSLIRSTKLLILAFFAAMTIMQSQLQTLPIWLMFVFIGLLMIAGLFHGVRILRAR